MMTLLDLIIDDAIKFGGFSFNGYNIEILRKVRVTYDALVNEYEEEDFYWVSAYKNRQYLFMNDANPIRLEELRKGFDTFILSCR
jgi:chlorite dismutase